MMTLLQKIVHHSNLSPRSDLPYCPRFFQPGPVTRDLFKALLKWESVPLSGTMIRLEELEPKYNWTRVRMGPSSSSAMAAGSYLKLIKQT